MALKCPVDHDKEVVIALAENSERFAINGSGVAIGLGLAFPRSFDQAGDSDPAPVVFPAAMQSIFP